MGGIEKNALFFLLLYNYNATNNLIIYFLLGCKATDINGNRHKATWKGKLDSTVKEATRSNNYPGTYKPQN